MKRECRLAAKRGDLSSARTLAKELVRSKKAKERIVISKARMNSIQMQLQEHMATLKMAGTLQKSAAIMTMMNELMRLPEMQRTMLLLAQEMAKAGLIDELVQETLDADADDEAADEEADEAVQRVLDELDLTFHEEAPTPLRAQQQRERGRSAAEEAEKEEEDAATDALQDRLNSLQQ